MFKNIKKLVFVAVAVLSFLAVPMFSVSAASISNEIGTQLGAAAGSKGAGFSAPQDPRAIAAQVIKTILTLLGTIFFVLTIYAGFLWMTAAGNDDQVGKAKSLLTQAVIGLIIILLSYSITYFVAKLALGQGTPDFNNGVYIQPLPPVSNQAPY